jgi:hypothetical protein
MLFRNCRNFFLAGTALSFGVVDSVSHDRQLQRTSAVFFNFSIALDLPESCDEYDLETIGLLIQDVIDEVELDIKEINEDFITATVCPISDMLGGSSRARVLRNDMHRMLAGTYTYKGVGTSRKTITNTRRSGDTILNRNNLNKLVAMCAQSEATANAYVANASEAQKAANMSLAEMSNIAKTTKQINKKKAMMYVVAAIEARVEGDLRVETARSMANTITETCRTINTTALNANTSKLVDVAIKLERNTKNESLAATIAFYRVEDESIMLKKEIAQAELDSRKADVSRMEKKLKEALKTLSFLTKRFRKMNSRVVDAMRKVDKAGKALLAAKVALEVNLNATWSIHEEKLNNDYALAIATLKVEAADITFDSLKAFAGLIELLLPARLLDGFGLNDSECIEGEPTVSVEAVEIEGQAGVVSVSNCDA